mmetsp:Transcript_1866/g.4100  ORF Transcript_1866/g.4100 Transcript_1866/m.4100 type:complete len:216 (-) Transcript_1866:326-973(-)
MVGIGPVRWKGGEVEGLADGHGQWPRAGGISVGDLVGGTGSTVVVTIIIEQIELIVHVFVRVRIVAPGNERASRTAAEGNVHVVAAEGAHGGKAFHDGSISISIARRCASIRTIVTVLLLFLLGSTLVLRIVQSAVQSADAAVHGRVAPSIVLGGRAAVGRRLRRRHDANRHGLVGLAVEPGPDGHERIRRAVRVAERRGAHVLSGAHRHHAGQS